MRFFRIDCRNTFLSISKICSVVYKIDMFIDRLSNIVSTQHGHHILHDIQKKHELSSKYFKLKIYYPQKFVFKSLFLT